MGGAALRKFGRAFQVYGPACLNARLLYADSLTGGTCSSGYVQQMADVHGCRSMLETGRQRSARLPGSHAVLTLVHLDRAGASSSIEHCAQSV